MLPKPKILYIDDEADLLDLAASFFEEENIPIETCSHFEGALEKVKKESYDLIITDIRTPSMKGQELLQAIRDEGRFRGKVILVTGDIEGVGTKNDKCDLVLFKPLRFQELIDRVKEILAL